jgi:hypothetical protein
MLFKKVTTFSVPPPIQKIYEGVARRGICPLLKGAADPLLTKKILDLLEAKNDPRSIIR